MEKLISVVMSTYNEPIKYIKKSINSIETQTWKNIEFIIVIDNPENEEFVNEIRKICSNYSNIILLINEKNKGLPYSLNRAIEHATGEYIARMDADDISFEERLEEEVYFLEKENLDMVSSNRINIDENGEIIFTKIRKKFDSKSINKLLPNFNLINHPSVLIKSSIIKNIKYRNFKAAQDYDLWLRMISYGYKIGIIDKPLIYYRIRNNSIGKKGNMLQRLLTEYIQKLYYERLYNSEDSYSESNIEKYLIEQGYYDEQKREKYIIALEQMERGIKSIRQKKFFVGMFYLIKATSETHIRKQIKDLVKYNIKRVILCK